MANESPRPPYEVVKVRESLADLKFDQMMSFAGFVVDIYKIDADIYKIDAMSTVTERTVRMAESLQEAAGAFCLAYTPGVKNVEAP